MMFDGHTGPVWTCVPTARGVTVCGIGDRASAACRDRCSRQKAVATSAIYASFPSLPNHRNRRAAAAAPPTLSLTVASAEMFNQSARGALVAAGLGHQPQVGKAGLVMTVAALLDIKPNDHLTLAPDDSVAAAISLFNAEKRGLIMVADTVNRLKGVVSVADVVRALGQHGAEALDLPLSKIMTSDVLVCDVDDALEDVLRKMNQRHVRHIPVVERGELKGVVDTQDVLASLLDEMRMNMDQLRNYFLKMGGRY